MRRGRDIRDGRWDDQVSAPLCSPRPRLAVAPAALARAPRRRPLPSGLAQRGLSSGVMFMMQPIRAPASGTARHCQPPPNAPAPPISSAPPITTLFERAFDAAEPRRLDGSRRPSPTQGHDPPARAIIQWRYLLDKQRRHPSAKSTRFLKSNAGLAVSRHAVRPRRDRRSTRGMDPHAVSPGSADRAPIRPSARSGSATR